MFPFQNKQTLEDETPVEGNSPHPKKSLYVVIETVLQIEDTVALLYAFSTRKLIAKEIEFNIKLAYNSAFLNSTKPIPLRAIGGF